MTEALPDIDQLVIYLKGQIPNCEITQSELTDLRGLYRFVERKDVVRTAKDAIKHRSMQPVSFMCRQLRIIKPSADPLNRQITRYGGKRVINGTDWDAVDYRCQQNRDAERAEYDRIHGQGAYDANDQQIYKKWHDFFVKREREALVRQTGQYKDKPKKQPKFSKETDEWYENLKKQVLEELAK